MAKTFKLQVVAPDRPALTQDVNLVVLPGSVGEFGIMAQHMPFLSSLKSGIMRIVKGQERELYFINGGYAQVNHGSVIVLAEGFEKAEEIDAERAQNSRKKAQEILSQKKDAAAMDQALAALARADARLKVVEEAKSLKN